ncbi:MAG: 7-carboxy-7-deazaguanine synthase [Lysobacterales bacterium]|jgi:7-carboxy-7-deazaguanine synthase
MNSSSENLVPRTREGMLKITEIFHSLQGEARDAGRPTVFIRLTGCPLRCHYCDSEYAFYGGEWMSFEDILSTTKSHGTNFVCVTGGEPLAQKRCTQLLTQLCEAGYRVSLETSGAMDIGVVDTRVSRVLDLKTPGSGEVERNLWANLEHLTPLDQVKFVICSPDDYEWSKKQLLDRDLNQLCDVLFSPSWGQMDATLLAEKVLEDKLPVRVQLQMHKLLWGDVPGK